MFERNRPAVTEAEGRPPWAGVNWDGRDPGPLPVCATAGFCGQQQCGGGCSWRDRQAQAAVTPRPTNPQPPPVVDDETGRKRYTNLQFSPCSIRRGGYWASCLYGSIAARACMRICVSLACPPDHTAVLPHRGPSAGPLGRGLLEKRPGQVEASLRNDSRPPGPHSAQLPSY